MQHSLVRKLNPIADDAPLCYHTAGPDLDAAADVRAGDVGAIPEVDAVGDDRVNDGGAGAEDAVGAQAGGGDAGVLANCARGSEYNVKVQGASPKNE